MGVRGLGWYSQICKYERTAMHDMWARTGFCKFGRMLASGNIFLHHCRKMNRQKKKDDRNKKSFSHRMQTKSSTFHQLNHLCQAYPFPISPSPYETTRAGRRKNYHHCPLYRLIFFLYYIFITWFITCEASVCISFLIRVLNETCRETRRDPRGDRSGREHSAEAGKNGCLN